MATSQRRMNGEGNPQKILHTGIEPVDDLLRALDAAHHLAPEDWLIIGALQEQKLPRRGRNRIANVLKEKAAYDQMRAQSPDPVVVLDYTLDQLKGRVRAASGVELVSETHQQLSSYREKRIREEEAGTFDITQDQVIAQTERSGPQAFEQMLDFIYAVGIAREDPNYTSIMPKNSLRILLGGNLEGRPGIAHVHRDQFELPLFETKGAMARWDRNVIFRASISDSIVKDTIGVAFVIPGKKDQEEPPGQGIRLVEPLPRQA